MSMMQMLLGSGGQRFKNLARVTANAGNGPTSASGTVSSVPSRLVFVLAYFYTSGGICTINGSSPTFAGGSGSAFWWAMDVGTATSINVALTPSFTQGSFAVFTVELVAGTFSGANCTLGAGTLTGTVPNGGFLLGTSHDNGGNTFTHGSDSFLEFTQTAGGAVGVADGHTAIDTSGGGSRTFNVSPGTGVMLAVS